MGQMLSTHIMYAMLVRFIWMLSLLSSERRQIYPVKVLGELFFSEISYDTTAASDDTYRQSDQDIDSTC